MGIFMFGSHLLRTARTEVFAVFAHMRVENWCMHSIIGRGWREYFNRQPGNFNSNWELLRVYSWLVSQHKWQEIKTWSLRRMWELPKQRHPDLWSCLRFLVNRPIYIWSTLGIFQKLAYSMVFGGSGCPLESKVVYWGNFLWILLFCLLLVDLEFGFVLFVFSCFFFFSSPKYPN